MIEWHKMLFRGRGISNFSNQKTEFEKFANFSNFFLSNRTNFELKFIEFFELFLPFRINRIAAGRKTITNTWDFEEKVYLFSSNEEILKFIQSSDKIESFKDLLKPLELDKTSSEPKKKQ